MLLIPVCQDTKSRFDSLQMYILLHERLENVIVYVVLAVEYVWLGKTSSSAVSDVNSSIALPSPQSTEMLAFVGQ